MTSVAFQIDQLFSPAPGGIGTYVRELIPRLRDADPELDVTLFHARFARPREPWTSGFPIEELAASPRRLYPSWNLLGRPALPASLRRADVLHAPSPASVPPPGPGQRLVVTVHDLAWRWYPRLYPPAWRGLFWAGTRRAARAADALITVSEHSATDLIRVARPDRAKVHVIPLAASLPSTPTEPDEVLERMQVRRPYLLFVGTLEPRKNLVRLVRAYRRAVASAGLPHRLVLAGPLGWRHQPLLRELALEGPGEVALTGSTGPRDLDALYRGAEAFAYPSLYEGFGLPVLEAMIRGVPAVVSNTSSLPEVAGDAALAVNPLSVSALSAAIRRVLTDPAEAERLSAAGRARAARFSWDQTARATLKVYESLV